MHDVTGPIDTLFVAGGDGTRAAASDPDFFFFFNDTATTDIYTTYDTLSLHDALPISRELSPGPGRWSASGRAPRLPARHGDRKSTRLTPVTVGYLVCRLLLEKKKKRSAKSRTDKKTLRNNQIQHKQQLN